MRTGYNMRPRNAGERAGGESWIHRRANREKGGRGGMVKPGYTAGPRERGEEGGVEGTRSRNRQKCRRARGVSMARIGTDDAVF